MTSGGQLLLALWALSLCSVTPAQAADMWQYGGFADVAYLHNFNTPENHQWRSKETSPRTNEFAPNMGLVYLRKDPAEQSRWGMELALQGGYDTERLAPEPQSGGTQPIASSDTLRHLARANVSYLAPVGHGITLTAGLLKGMKTYEEFYAKYNFNYTRAYLTDYNPNFLIGIGASYPVTRSFELGFYVVNEYQHLSHANDLPSYVGKMEWRATHNITIYENVYYGPDQQAASLKYWRTFSDSTVEWRSPDWRIAVSYDVGTEQVADAMSRATWMGGALFTQWHLAGPWSVAVRPEFYWDPQGRMTEREQLLWANTTTLEYKKHVGQQLVILRLEHRFDHSTGSQGGFFYNGLSPSGMPALRSSQHLAIVGLIWAFDSA
jgi:hypothetical protein